MPRCARRHVVIPDAGSAGGSSQHRSQWRRSCLWVYDRVGAKTRAGMIMVDTLITFVSARLSLCLRAAAGAQTGCPGGHVVLRLWPLVAPSLPVGTLCTARWRYLAEVVGILQPPHA